MAKGIPIAEATLSNVADGELERQFQMAKDKVLDALAEYERYEHTAKNVMVTKIQCEIRIERDSQIRSVSITARAWPVLPKSNPVTRGAFVKDGELLVEDTEQLPLEGNVRPINTKGEGQ